MPTRLLPLPAPLLNPLGYASRQGALDSALKTLAPPLPHLYQIRNGDLYPVSVPGQGLDLMLQCLNPHAPESERRWGLHSLTFHTATSDPASHWTKGWPGGVHPDTATAGIIVSLLAEDDDDAVLMTDGMACFEVPGFDTRRWIVQCMFDPVHKTLLTFSLIRNGEWADAQWPPEEAET